MIQPTVPVKVIPPKVPKSHRTIVALTPATREKLRNNGARLAENLNFKTTARRVQRDGRKIQHALNMGIEVRVYGPLPAENGTDYRERLIGRASSDSQAAHMLDNARTAMYQTENMAQYAHLSEWFFTSEETGRKVYHGSETFWKLYRRGNTTFNRGCFFSSRSMGR